MTRQLPETALGPYSALSRPVLGGRVGRPKPTETGMSLVAFNGEAWRPAGRGHHGGMGLDNLPAVYPCQKAGTALVDANGRIDCTRTQATGGCPWKTRSDGERPGQAVYGMLGTSCWWRGKVSTWHLDLLATAGHRLPNELGGGFYGASDGDPTLPPTYCRALADWLADHAEAFAAAAETAAGRTAPEELASLVDEYRYAIWWLRFVADTADGARAWW